MGRRFVASEEVDPGTPLSDVLKRLVRPVQGFDKITRFRLAAKDMSLAAHAAAALVDAAEGHGSVRAYDRVLETGMVVAYVRPFLESRECVDRSLQGPGSKEGANADVNVGPVCCQIGGPRSSDPTSRPVSRGRSCCRGVRARASPIRPW